MAISRPVLWIFRKFGRQLRWAWLLALAGCATTPAVRVQTVTVDRPIAVTCVKRADLPVEPAALGALPPDARQAADLLGALDLTLRAWGRKQAALLIGCSTD